MDAFAWPLGVVILGIIFMLIFRQQIAAFIGRLRKVGRAGLETGSDQPQKAPDRESTAEDSEELMRSFDSPILRQQEVALQTDLNNRGLSGDEATKVLIRHLAATQLGLRFEQLNNVVWGSQISLLRLLNSSTAGETAETVRSFYDHAAAQYPNVYANYPFKSYMTFLMHIRLVIVQEGKHMITEFGRDFLTYLVKTGRTEFRLY